MRVEVIVDGGILFISKMVAIEVDVEVRLCLCHSQAPHTYTYIQVQLIVQEMFGSSTICPDRNR
jgi:hypothetical protein